MTARWIVVLAGILSLLIGTQASAAPPAVFTVAAGTTISPANADAWYCAQTSTCTNSGTRDFWTNNYPVEITALATALHHDADLIYEYVRNNIEIVPIYGLQKGALGALIDRSGTAFDQAQLMVELLRTSGYTASYVQGTITLNASQVQQWLGVSDAAALTQILADGGIPATVTPTSGPVTSVTLEHIWVQAALPAKGTYPSGTYVFDPSFKPHTYTSKVDIGAASGWSDSTFLAAGQDTMVSGTQTAPSDVPPNANIAIPYVTNVDEGKLEGQLTSYAVALETYLKKNGSVSGQVYAQEQLDDVIGRQDIVWASGILRQSTLSYAASPAPHAVHIWSGNIPDVYRVRVTIEMLDISASNVRLSQTFFADEIYGRKIQYDSYLGIDTWTDDHIQLRIDGVYVGSQYAGSDSPGARTGYVRLSIDHPYAANGGTYLDLAGSNAILKQADFVSPVGIVLGLGDTSDRLAAKLATEQVYDKLLPPSTYYGNSCEPLNRPDQPAQETTLARAYAGWLAQYSRMASIQARMLSATHVQHHTLGLAYRRSFLTNPSSQCAPQDWAVGEGELVLDLDTAVSVNSNTAVANDRRTLARSLAAAADTLEAAQFEQLANTATPASVAHRFEWNTNQAANAKYFLVQPGGNSVSLFPTGPTPYYWPSIYAPVSVYTNAGYKVIVAENEFMGPGRDCLTPPCTSSQRIFRFERGGAFEAFAADGVTTAHIVTDQTSGAIKGGSAGDPPNYDETYKADKSADLLKDQFKDRSDDFGVALSTGEFTHGEGTDVSVGLGDFPYKLSWERTFKSGESHSPGMGKGWSHNLDIRVNLTTSGSAAFGKGG